MLTTTFQKKIEDFVCGHCGLAVRGNGYTNHCPDCLWSRHVDNHPGDRLARCGGMMAPVDYRAVSGGYDVLHHCEKCGHEKWNKLDRGDKLDVLIA
ncbi:RNHCP domain-containing protein [Candidatus Nomurabacteria bacterium]|nr:RNHCP domain-containing protein [Candidatus Nomurabacteria bacterium]